MEISRGSCYPCVMEKERSKAEIEFNEWIEQGLVIDYWVSTSKLTTQGILTGERRGFGRLSRPHEGLIVLNSPDGEELVVSANATDVIDYCDSPAKGYRLQVRTQNYDTWIAFKPSDVTY
jgi:hypothetical protein